MTEAEHTMWMKGQGLSQSHVPPARAMTTTRGAWRQRHAPPGRALVAAAILLTTGGVGLAALRRVPATPLVYTVTVGRGPTAAIMDAGGPLFVSNDADATVSALDAATCRPLYTVRTGVTGVLTAQAMALDAGRQRLFVVNSDDIGTASQLVALDARTGAIVRVVRAGHNARAVAVDTRAGHVFVANAADHTVSMLDAAGLALVRTVDVPYAPTAIAVDARAARAVVVGYSDRFHDPDERTMGWASLLDTGAGTLLRTVGLGAGAGAVVVDAPAGRAVVANEADGTLSLLDTRSGRVVRTVPVSQGPMTLAVDARRGRVVVMNGWDGVLRVVDARTGTLLRTAYLGSPPSVMAAPPRAVAVDERSGRVFVTAWGRTDAVGLPLGDGWVQALDASTGAAPVTIPVGVAPVAISVEERSGRAIVVNGGGVIDADGGWQGQVLRRAGQWLPWLPWLSPGATARPPVPGSVSVLAPSAAL